MSSGLKNFGLFAGVLAFFACLFGGFCLVSTNGTLGLGLGLGVVGFGIFAGASLIIGVLRESTISEPKAVKPAVQVKKATSAPTKTAKPQEAKAEAKTDTATNGLVNLYVGNLPYEAADNDVRMAFEAFGTISTVRVVKDKPSGRSKGFAFVEMPIRAEADAAIEGMNGREFSGKKLKVSEAKAKTRNPRSRGSNFKKPADRKDDRKDDREVEMVDWDS